MNWRRGGMGMRLGFEACGSLEMPDCLVLGHNSCVSRYSKSEAADTRPSISRNLYDQEDKR